ncbi:MAG: terminase gpA endonuclease subunit, partial [Pseudomonadota bacterium]
STVRGKTSPVLVGDEIDAWKRGGKQGINDPRKMMSYRRLTFGKRSKLYMCSHPDLGENAGIYMYYGQSDQRRWFWPCPHCNGFSTPYPGTDMPTTKLAYKKPEGKSVAESLEEIAASAHLECPHCGCEIDHKHKHQMNKAGKWLARGEKMDFATGEITGQRFANPMAGWTLHGTMSPFVSWGDLACDLAEARERFALTQDDKQLKEVVVKGLGECYAGPEEKRVPMDAKSVQKRLRADDDWFGLVPRFHEDGRLKVQFLTASVDTQGWGFAVGIIGWGGHGESWLVDRFDIKQITGFQNIQPHVRVDDWQVLSDFLTTQIYPFHEDETRGLKIASMAIDSQGEPGVVPNARAFNRKLVEIGMPDWKVRFIRGGRPALRDLDVANIIDRDEQNKPVEPKIFEYTIRVDDIKDIITQRLKIEQQGPGFMHIPANAPSFVYDELTNEKKVEGKYQRHGPNETFDHYVYGEWTRLKLRPEREELDFVKAPPIWAMPVPTGLGESQAPQHDTKTDLRAAVRRLV